MFKQPQYQNLGSASQSTSRVMASIPSTPTYFLAPSCDFPADGLIALGSIIVHPKTPQKSLNHRDNQRVAVPANDLQESFKDNWEDVIKTARHNKVALWASFLQMILGFGTGVSVGVKQGRDDIYKFRQLETKFFEPDAAYIENSLKAEGVIAYISATRCKKPVYMITGVKIARGASVTSKTLKGYEAMLKVGFDGTTLTGVPISGGPKVETNSTKEREVKFDNGSDYVFAYRVVKIQLSEDGNVKGHKDYVKGALFGTDEGTNSKKDLVGWGMEQLIAASEELQNNAVVSEAYEDGQTVIDIRDRIKVKRKFKRSEHSVQTNNTNN
ncbi:hypothetical protein BDZ45DRAFT_809578 [Acephala macrosclerotiorum]|nr:hypothetical protein BDZ45DRAFT_809578 [Acephala macrosclerotiorum]